MEETGTRGGLAAGATDGMDAVSREDWNGLLAQGQGPLRHGYVRAWEHATLPGLVSRPLLAHEGGRLVAAAPAYFYDLDMAVVQSHAVGDVLKVARRLLPRLLVSRVYEVGSPTPLVPPFLRAADAPARPAARALLEASVEEAEAGEADMLIVQNFEGAGRATADSEACEELGFACVPIPPTVLVQLPWSDFDEYLGSMRSQYRRRARKTLQASSHLRVELVEDFGGLTPELARLWRLVYDRADEVKREVLPQSYFEAAAPLDYLSVLALRRGDGSLASYALLLDDRPRLHFLYTGFEEAAGRDEAAYFRLLYEIVRHGIEEGYSSVNLGITTLAPKLDVGGVPVPLYGWIRHRRPVLQRAFAKLAAGPFAPAPAEPRNVFKD